MKKVVVIVSSREFTSKLYDQVWDDLRKAGFSHPKGLLSHVGFANPDGGWMVVDVWESKDAFNEYSKTLIPLIQKTGAKIEPPKIVPVHYFYQAQAERTPA